MMDTASFATLAFLQSLGWPELLILFGCPALIYWLIRRWIKANRDSASTRECVCPKPGCGHRNREDARFCARCGASVSVKDRQIEKIS